jgi:hypothetical protein
VRGFKAVRDNFHDRIRHQILNDLALHAGQQVSDRCDGITFNPPTGRQSRGDKLSLLRIGQATTDQGELEQMREVLRGILRD